MVGGSWRRFPWQVLTTARRGRGIRHGILRRSGTTGLGPAVAGQIEQHEEGRRRSRGSHGGGIGIAFLFCSWDVDRFFLRPGVEDRATDGRGAHGPNRGANDVRSTEASSGDDV